VLLLSATASVLIGAVMVVLIVAVTGQRNAARSAFRSQEALAAGNQLEKSLITIENGVRGYVASRREKFLDPANEALTSYPGEVRRLTSLVDDDPGQQARARDIGGEIDDYVTLWARPLIGLARTRPASLESRNRVAFVTPARRSAATWRSTARSSPPWTRYRLWTTSTRGSLIEARARA